MVGKIKRPAYQSRCSQQCVMNVITNSATIWAMEKLILQTLHCATNPIILTQTIQRQLENWRSLTLNFSYFLIDITTYNKFTFLSRDRLTIAHSLHPFPAYGFGFASVDEPLIYPQQAYYLTHWTARFTFAVPPSEYNSEKPTVFPRQALYWGR